MSTKRLVPAALLGVVTSAVASVALATPATAGVSAASGCRFELVSVTANELQENNQDEFYLEIGDEYTKVVKFAQGETHGAAAFGSGAQTTEFIPAGGSIIVRGWENDLIGDDKIGAVAIRCSAIDDDFDLDGNGANYTVRYRVVALP